ncbi:hypothetical protein [Polynucleobacter sphagniphilus]|jgi:hypothetical protein|uniref:hypothetical protein n=1 Tax=Polynucleobacter sphagniphilus TaxID=1743169 RepID=UPI0024762F0E|nr:hypothetical protein [Polynucleobacter sphagniphilus]MDH6524598.1 hypothetical protein [Polynucleobacter sphagniphilus]
MKRRSIRARSFWIMIVAGMLTGMGNGSVFGAALMCFLGRGMFSDWGGWFGPAYNPTSFTGFIDWCMIIFGLAYVGILSVAFKRHDEIENSETVSA